MPTKKIPLPGSMRHPVGSRVGSQPKTETIEVSVILKPKTPVPVPTDGGAVVSREDFAEKYGPDPKAIQQVREFAKQHRLTVGQVSRARRTVKLKGTVADMTRAFSVKFDKYEY